MNINNKQYLLSYLKKRLIPNIDNKDNKGEVFTSIECIEHILEKLNKHYKNKHGICIFSNKNLRWLDPSSGIGNFMIIIYYKLMDGLNSIIPDEEERHNHILNNMLYFSELSKDNVEETISIFNHDININNGNSLELNIYGKWNIEKMDIVIGNPPFNEKRNKTGNNNKWSEFITYYFPIINDSGYMCYITPPSWMSPACKYKDIFYDNNLVYLNVNECRKYFEHVASQFTIFIINKNLNKEKTEIICKYKNSIYNSNILLNNIKYIPLLSNKDTFNIINKFYNNNLEKISFKTSCQLHNSIKKLYLSDINDKEFIYPVKHLINKIRYSSIKHDLSDKNKILMNLSSSLKPTYDDGKYGITQAQLYYLTNDETYVNILKSDVYTFIFKISRWAGFNIKQVFENIPYIKHRKNTNLYKKFNLNENEIKLIKEYVIKHKERDEG
tara:strand:- start:462 stop:1787 length:1326 start_codon:yes stop_codon:yes gene_type:complete